MGSLQFDNVVKHALAELSSNERSGSIRPVVEKEILHYEILNALDVAGILNKVVFQGGTCLRLCYGGMRYSEDLDFCSGLNLSDELLAAIPNAIKHALMSSYGLESKISEPKITRIDEFKSDASGSAANDCSQTVSKWAITVESAPQRRDIARQRINIEIATVPSHTLVVRPVSINYRVLSPVYHGLLAQCESLNEILADKLKAFVTATHIRYRDIWDMDWLMSQSFINVANIKPVFIKKLQDYRAEELFYSRYDKALSGLQDMVHEQEFIKQMSRFLPNSAIVRTISRPEYRTMMAERIVELYRTITQLVCE
jgi:predicted nucleotidyltransferase component of viral defense system